MRSKRLLLGAPVGKFLEAALKAWNPIGEARRRMEAGTLFVESVLVPSVGIAIACTIFSLGGLKFFSEALAHAAGGRLTEHPITNSAYAQQFIVGFNVLVVAASVSALPARTFNPRGRSATVAAIFLVLAASAFYNALLLVPVYVFPGILVADNPRLGLTVFMWFGIPASLAAFALSLFFWFRALFSVLRLSGIQVIFITFAAAVALGALTSVFLMLAERAA